MRFLALFFLCFLLSEITFGQTIRAFLIADTGHPETGKGHAKNLLRMQSEVDLMAKATKMSLDTTIIQGSLLTANYVRNQLESLRCGVHDIVIFYFSGREYIPTRYRGTSKEAFLDLNNGFILPSGVSDLIENQKPKFTIVITDLCNRMDKENTELAPKNTSLNKYQGLLLNSSGKLLLHNHIAREQSDLMLTTEGSIFTASVLKAMRESKDWDDVIHRSRALTINQSQGTQNPQITANVKTLRHQKDTLVIDNQSNNLRLSDKPQKNDENLQVINRLPKNKVSLHRELPLRLPPTIDYQKQKQLQQQSIQMIQTFQQNLSRLAELGTTKNNRQTNALVQEMVSLFTSKKRTIETSGLSQRISKKWIKSYLNAFNKPYANQRIEILWYKSPKVGAIQYVNNQYKCEVTVFQEYLKRDAKGSIIYGDRVPKKIDVIFTPDGSQKGGYRTQLGNIGIAGKTQLSPKHK